MGKNGASIISAELLQNIKQFSRLRWEQNPIQELRSSECELLGLLYINLGNGTKAIPASGISNQLHITPAAVTHLLNPLENAGYIHRHKDPSDRRYVLISLSIKGKRAAETMILDAQEKLTELVSHLGEDDSRTLNRIMSNLIDYISANPMGS
jgi:DNA-binding MarR family transcriptional regulator